MVVGLMLPLHDNEAETTTLDACCAVQSEAVVKVRQTAWCDRCWAAASRILASLGHRAKLLERGPTTMKCRSAPCDLTESPRRHSSAGLTVSAATCCPTGRQSRCDSKPRSSMLIVSSIADLRNQNSTLAATCFASTRTCSGTSPWVDLFQDDLFRYPLATSFG